MEQDSPWKVIVEELFEDFLAFFFPDIHKDIDFSKGYKFRDKELEKILKTSKTGKRFGDKLVEVFLKDGSEQWLRRRRKCHTYLVQNGWESKRGYNKECKKSSSAKWTPASVRFRTKSRKGSKI